MREINDIYSDEGLLILSRLRNENLSVGELSRDLCRMFDMFSYPEQSEDCAALLSKLKQTCFAEQAKTIAPGASLRVPKSPKVTKAGKEPIVKKRKLSVSEPAASDSDDGTPSYDLHHESDDETAPRHFSSPVVQPPSELKRASNIVTTAKRETKAAPAHKEAKASETSKGAKAGRGRPPNKTFIRQGKFLVRDRQVGYLEVKFEDESAPEVKGDLMAVLIYRMISDQVGAIGSGMFLTENKEGGWWSIPTASLICWKDVRIVAVTRVGADAIVPTYIDIKFLSPDFTNKWSQPEEVKFNKEGKMLETSATKQFYKSFADKKLKLYEKMEKFTDMVDVHVDQLSDGSDSDTK
jgi:hypothetical protein